MAEYEIVIQVMSSRGGGREDMDFDVPDFFVIRMIAADEPGSMHVMVNGTLTPHDYEMFGLTMQEVADYLMKKYKHAPNANHRITYITKRKIYCNPTLIKDT